VTSQALVLIAVMSDMERIGQTRLPMTTEAVLLVGHMSKLMRREEVAEGTMAFHFEKPFEFNFKAGQFADVTLTDPPETDAEGNTRTFSIASPPFENEIVFATRMRGTAFKRSLKRVPLATEVQIGSASGSFTRHKNPAKPAVLLAGGIGITPFSQDRSRCMNSPRLKAVIEGKINGT
jgi:predicted ferric reductase